MAEKYSFFNSKDHDRKYNAKDWADYFFPLFKSGVFNGDLQVVANGGMQIKVKTGYAWIDGYGYHLTEELDLDLETASGNMNRKDIIVIRLDLTNRWIKSYCKTGAYYAKEAAPPEQEITKTIHEIVIAKINVPAGTTEITQNMIEDTRMDDNLCGWVCGAVKQIEFEQIYEQFKAFQKEKEEEALTWINTNTEWTNQFKEDAQGEFWKWFSENTGNWNQEVQEWFDNIKEHLSSEMGINLQNQIGNLDNLVTEDKSNLVAAVNETRQQIRVPINSFLVKEPGNPLDAAIAPIIKEELDASKEDIKRIDDELSELNGSLKSLVAFTTVNTVAAIKTGFQTINIKIPTNGNYTWKRINTACSGFVTVMHGSDNVLAVESTSASTANVTFINTFIGVKKL